MIKPHVPYPTLVYKEQTLPIIVSTTYQLATFREPFAEERMCINFNQLGLWVSVKHKMMSLAVHKYTHASLKRKYTHQSKTIYPQTWS